MAFLTLCETPAKWHFSLFVCQRKDYTLEWQWWADIFLVVTLEKHREFFNHLKVILSERIGIIQFRPNLPERKAETITTIDFSPLQPQIHCQKYWKDGACHSAPLFVISKMKMGLWQTPAYYSVWRDTHRCKAAWLAGSGTFTPWQSLLPVSGSRGFPENSAPF